MTESIRFPVTGMTCVSCVNRITRSLRRIDGVDRIKVDLTRETVALRRDPERVSNAALAAAVAKAGYEADVADVAVLNEPVVQRGGLARLFRRWDKGEEITR